MLSGSLQLCKEVMLFWVLVDNYFSIHLVTTPPHQQKNFSRFPRIKLLSLFKDIICECILLSFMGIWGKMEMDHT